MPRTNGKQKIINALCEKYVLDVVMLSSSDEEEEDDLNENFRMNIVSLLSNRRSVHLGLPKSTDWQQNVLRNLDDNIFCQMVRMLPGEFEHILNLIKGDAVFNQLSCTAQLPVELQLKIVLYRLGSSGDGSSVRKTASIFGVGDGGTIHAVTKRVFKAIINLKNRFLYWPNNTERLQLISATSNELPGCVGYIDGSEIKLAEAPAKDHEHYFSRKRQYAIKIQAICDYKLRIRQVTSGYAGSVHDAKMFFNSPIARHPEHYLSDSQWLAGDSAYPLKSFLITPFRTNNTEHTNEARKQFNKYFSKYRVRIENCFGLLKEKFGSLKELKFRMLNERNRKECNQWIMVCCILHNIRLYFNDDRDEPSTKLSQHKVILPPSNNTRNSLLSYLQNQPDF